MTTATTRAALEPVRLEQALPDKLPVYTDAEARAEAERCLYCADAPCIQACPTEIDIPTFIKKIASGNVRGSAKTIFEQNLLGVSCSRVCPVEVLCEGSCVYGAWGREPITIGRLQRFATETTLATLAKKPGAAPLFAPKPKTGKRVALVGGGPASLACAGTLALEGHTAVIFEKRPLAGGLNTTGIAPYKLHAEESLAEVEFVTALGVEIRTGQGVGEPGGPTAASLLAEFDAVFLGLGLGADTSLGIPGEDGPGVVGATAWIEHMKLSSSGADRQAKLGQVVVVGGGNTALDVVREAALLGAEKVTMVYRRGQADMSGYAHELEGARTEGVVLATHLQPVAFVRDGAGTLTALRVAKTDASGKPQAGTEHEIPCDLVALAIGQSKLQAIAKAFDGVALDAKGRVVVDGATRRSGNPKVYAGGDCINGGKEVVNAVADGRDAAKAMHEAFTAR